MLRIAGLSLGMKPPALKLQKHDHRLLYLLKECAHTQLRLSVTLIQNPRKYDHSPPTPDLNVGHACDSPYRITQISFGPIINVCIMILCFLYPVQWHG